MNSASAKSPKPAPDERSRSAGFTFAAGSQPLPGFTIKRGLGHGGFGEVYYAVSDAGKEVALKLVRRNLEVELRGVTQCLNVKHSNLIGLYDVRTDSAGNFWIVMEYVAGERLSDALDRFSVGMPVEQALAWFRGIAAGTAFLHDNGIVHRDLKPANIFIENGVVKIGDYGLSKFISVSRRSGQTESVGTVHYMAPEISGGRYGKQIDVYALGILLYELLTGRVPFDGESVGEILMKHLTAEPDLSAVAEPYRGAIRAALQKDPDRRPRSVEEFVGWINGNAAMPSLHATPRPPTLAPPLIPKAPTTPNSAPVSAARRPAMLWVGMAAALALVVALYIAWRISPPTPQTRIEVPSGAEVRINRLDVQGGDAPSRTSVAVPEPQVASRLIGLTTLGVSLCGIGVGLVVWKRRRRAIEAHRRLAETEILIVPPETLRRIAFRDAAREVTGGWLMASVGAIVVTRLLLLFRSQALELNELLWGAATTATAASLLVAVLIPLRRHSLEPSSRRLLLTVAGLAVGAAAWFYAEYLGFTPRFEFSMEGVRPESWPECYEAGRPLLPAYVIYFGATFFLVDWWSIVSPSRYGGLHLTDAFAALFWAGVVHLLFPFPQGWGFLVVAGTALVLPWAMPAPRRPTRTVL